MKFLESLARRLTRVSSTLRDKAAPQAGDAASAESSALSQATVGATVSEVASSVQLEPVLTESSAPADAKAPRPLPIIGRLPLTAQYALTAFAALTLVVSAILAGLSSTALEAHRDDAVKRVQSSSLVLQQMHGEVRAAAAGSAVSFGVANETAFALLSNLSALVSYSNVAADLTNVLPPAPVERVDWISPLWKRQGLPEIDLAPLVTLGLEIQELFDQVLAREPVLGSYVTAIATIKQRIGDLDAFVRGARQSGIAGADVLADDIRDFDRLFDQYAQAPADRRPAEAALDVLVNIGVKARAMSTQARVTPKDAQAASQAAEIAATDLPMLIRAANTAYDEFALRVAPEMARAQAKVRSFNQMAPTAVAQPEIIVTMRYLALGLFSMGLMFIAILMAVGSRATAFSNWSAAQAAKASAQEAERERQMLDEAVLNLMQQMRPAARGDLTARLQVREDATGSVADRFNAVVENLESAIDGVKERTRVAMTSIEAIAQQTSVTRTSAGNALAISDQARKAAHAGGGAVGQAVERANEHRVLMQNLAKQAKAVGQMAQGVGQVTAIIEEAIAKTRVLALNAAVHQSNGAASAGGNVTGTIASFLDRMAEELSDSLGRINSTVAEVQGETGRMITTVESMTVEVVAATSAWDSANAALKDISSLADNVDAVIGEITQAAATESELAQRAVTHIQTLATEAAQFTTAFDKVPVQPPTASSSAANDDRAAVLAA